MQCGNIRKPCPLQQKKNEYKTSEEPVLPSSPQMPRPLCRHCVFLINLLHKIRCPQRFFSLSSFLHCAQTSLSRYRITLSASPQKIQQGWNFLRMMRLPSTFHPRSADGYARLPEGADSRRQERETLRPRPVLYRYDLAW